MNKPFLLSLCLLLLFGSSGLLSANSTELLELSAVEDTHVDSRYPDRNYGDGDWGSISMEARSFLKFELPHLANRKVVAAKISVTLYRTSAYPQEVRIVPDNSWDEMAMTWNNQPTLSPTVTGRFINTKGQTVSNRRYEVSLGADTLETLSGTQQSHISFAISAEENGLLYLVSKNNRYAVAKLHLQTEPLATTTQVPVSADTYVDARYPDYNFSTDKVLKVDAHPDEKAYLAFDLSQFARDSLLGATLNLKVTNPSDDQQQLYLVNDAATDLAQIRYTHQPTHSTQAIATLDGGAKGEWVSVDLAAAVQQQRGKRLVLMMQSTGSNGIDFLAQGHQDAPYLSIQHVAAQAINSKMRLGINIAEPSWYSTEWPFIDLMKTSLGIWRTSCKRWGSNRDPNCASFGVGDNTKEQAKLDVDENDWVRSLPPRGQFNVDGTTFTQVNTKVPTSLNPENTGGQYVVRYDGEGVLSYDAPVKKLASSAGRDVIELHYDPSKTIREQQAFVLRILQTDPNKTGNYLRNIRVYPPGGMCLHNETQFCDPNGAATQCAGSPCISLEQAAEEHGKRFDPRFLANIKDYDNIRFMGFQDTNGALKTTTWADRTRPEMRTYHRDGYDRGAIEVMTELGNVLDTSIWVNMPPKVDDDYIRRFAQLTLDTLEPEREVYVEYSNEAWNFGFKATYWMQDQAKALWPQETEANAYLKGLNWYGMRSMQVCQIWQQVWVGQTERLHCVVGTHTGWPSMMSVPLKCPLWQKYNGGDACYTQGIDAIAVAPYFGHYLGVGGNVKYVEPWTQDADGGLDRAFRELLVGGEMPGGEPGGALLAARANMLKSKEYADKLGLDLVSYEGGQHLSATQSARQSPAIVNLLSDINRDPRMQTVYTRYLDYWSEAGGGLFNQWTSVGPYSVWGNWGAKEYRDQTHAPKHEALMQYLQWLPHKQQ